MKITEEQKKLWAEKAKQTQWEAFQTLKRVAEEYRQNPEKIAEYFQFAEKFYQYSPRNVTLIYSQNPNATFVQSFKGWKDMDAAVAKGAKGIRILVPVTTTYLRIEDELVKLSDATPGQKELYKKGALESVQRLHFSSGSVFDISQTTFPKEKYPELFGMGNESRSHEQMTNALIKFAEHEIKCPVEIKNLESISLRGYYTPERNRIVLNKFLNDTERLSTMSHELGHALIHYDRQNRSEAQVEFEGDGLSIMLLQHHGIDLEDARKDHLAHHYRIFRAECRNGIQKECKDISPEELEEKADEKIQESFSNVFHAYRGCIDTIDRYIENELEKETLDSVRLPEKSVQLLEKNGVDPDFVKAAAESHILESYEGDLACVYHSTQGDVIVPFNKFVVPTATDTRNRYQEGNRDALLVTGNRMEYLAQVSHGKDVLLVEKNDMEDIRIKKSYQSIKYGTGLEGKKDMLKQRIPVKEASKNLSVKAPGLEI